MGIFRNGISRNGPWVAGVQRQNVWVAGVNRLTGEIVVNANGTAVYSAFTTGNIVGGTFSHYTFGAFTYAPLTAGSDVEFIDQIGTAASVTANYTNATRTDSRTCDLDTSAPNGGLPTGTGVAGTCSNPNNMIGATDTSVTTGLARTLSGFTPTTGNGGIVTRTISNDDYEPGVAGPTIEITNMVASFTRPNTFTITYTVTAGDNTIPATGAVTFEDDNDMWDVSTTGVVTSFRVGTATITATVTDSIGNTASDTILLTASNPVAPTIDVTPESRIIAEGGGAGIAFTVFTTGTVTVTVTGENAGVIPDWFTIGTDEDTGLIDGTWSASENTGAARNTVIRFTARDGVSQSVFDEVSVSQAAAAATVECFTYTFTPGPDGTQAAAIGSYILCSGAVFTTSTIPLGPGGTPFSACIREGTALAPGSGSWSKGASCS